MSRIAAWLESAAKVALLISTGLAITGEVTIGFRYLHALAWLVPSVLVAAFLLARIRLVVATWPLLAATFLVPALLRIWIGPFLMYHVVWYAGILGLIASDRELLRWHMPVAWRPWLACWGLVLALSWPVIVGRELEWSLAHLYDHAIVVSGSGGIARNQVDWIFAVAATYGLGMLWLDWLFRIYNGETDFRRVILLPITVSWIAAMVVGLYQLTIDPTLFALGFWVTLKRVVGPLLDANGFGMVAALWGVPIAAVALSRPTPLRVAGALATLGLSLAGVWGSGSRNAFFVAVCGIAAFSVILLRDRAFAQTRVRMASAVVGVAAIVVATVIVARAPVIGPLQRIGELVHGQSVGQFLYQFWERGQYGAAGNEAIRRWPLVGTGIGTFHGLVGDIWFSAGHIRLQPDNAQSWYRHQLAEIGILGSIGWIIWLGLVVVAVLSPIRQQADSVVLRATRAMIVLLAMVELVGIPTQVFAVAFSFLTMLAWNVNGRERLACRGIAFRWPPYLWIAVWAIALLHAGLTAVDARGDLRVPNRAAWANFEYEDGFYAEPMPGMQPGQGRAVRPHAVAVPYASGPVARVTVSVPHPDADSVPVHVDVWVDGRHAINQRVLRLSPVVRYVPVRTGTRFVLETEVNRAFHPPGDTREYGAVINWEFVDRIPD